MLKKLFSRFTFVALTIIILFVVDVLFIVGLALLLSAWLSVLYPAAGEWIAFGMTVLSWIVTFLTVLELMKMGKITVSQEHIFDDIYIISRIAA